MPYEQEKANTLNTALKDKKIKHIGCFVGPEGGFEAVEVESAKASGILPVTLGPRILRTETAGFAVLTCVMYEYEQMH
jgi:16S rRNA (uracil1498-N3)-methyltransferase